MIASIGLVFVLGLLAGGACRRAGLPRIVGMLLAGVLAGPCALNLLDAQTLVVSAELRRMALVIILLRAGLTLDVGDLRRVGRPAVLMAFLPALCEIAACVLLAPMIFGVTRAEAAVLGAVLGAVSPAVVVPRMVALIERRRGTAQGVPQLILAGASLDDVFVIVLFSSFAALAQGASMSAARLLEIPVSAALGVAVGAACGWALAGLLGALARRGGRCALYAAGGARRRAAAPAGAGGAQRRCVAVHGGRRAWHARARVLRACLSAEGDRAGGDWRRAAGDGPALRGAGALRGRALHPDHRAAGRVGHRRDGGAAA